MILLSLVLAFLCGAIPFGVLIGRRMGVDVRAVGSGNIGATNVWRALGWKAGTLAFVLDVCKGLAGPLLARALVPENPPVAALCGIAAVLGHSFSPFLKFKGGKGIATSLGALLGMIPLVGLLCFALWAVVLAVSRMVSVASMAACVALPLAAWAFDVPRPYLVVATLMAVVAFLKHLPNLKRVLAGTEPRLGRQAAAARAVEQSAPAAREAAGKTGSY